MSGKAFSAPGKAMLAGGYLVLFPQYKAFVVALSTRMHAKVLGSLDESLEATTITVKSPQFEHGEWIYTVKHGESGLDVIDNSTYGNNPFLKSAIKIILTYFNSKTHANIEIEIFSDPAYHSQDGAQERQSTNGKKKFLYHSSPISKVPKTGLGSSAGLVTVITSSLISIYRPDIDILSESGLRLVHNLAQISHCVAQGKIGSGFDVAAATYGSITYQRFPKELISDIINESGSLDVEKLIEIVDSKWPMSIENCSLPPKIKLLMGDVHRGSETPKLVSKVFAWKDANPKAAETLFENLNNCNMKLVNELSQLNKLAKTDPDTYEEIISFLDDYSLIQLKHLIKISDRSFANKMTPVLAIIESISSIRIYLQELTRETGAPIEPFEQTVLLDNCFTLPGVIGGVVPGAGGDDAICLLASENAIDKIIKVTSVLAKDVADFKKQLAKMSKHTQKEFENVDLDTIELKLFEHVSWLDLHEQEKGLKLEDASDYDGL